jgi:hypothetical protein
MSPAAQEGHKTCRDVLIQQDSRQQS